MFPRDLCIGSERECEGTKQREISSQFGELSTKGFSEGGVAIQFAVLAGLLPTGLDNLLALDLLEQNMLIAVEQAKREEACGEE